jgi:hypothetical protein
MKRRSSVDVERSLLARGKEAAPLVPMAGAIRHCCHSRERRDGGREEGGLATPGRKL